MKTIDNAKELEVGEDVSRSTVLYRHMHPLSTCLLIINKGPGAIRIKREGQEWDLMEIFFAKNDIEAVKRDPSVSTADHIVFESDRNMRKFAIIKRVLERYPVFQKYEVVMMIDDDLEPVGCSIADVFSQFIETGFRVGQPALTRDSYWSHEVVLRHNGYKWRKTNFVEVMCPIMKSAAIRDYLPLFDATVSGFGLDTYWSTCEWKGHGGLVVLDSTPMRHTRPVRGGVAYQGISPGEERLAFFEKYKLKNYRHFTLGGESTSAEITPKNGRIAYRSQYSDIAKFKTKRFAQRTFFYLLFGFCFLRSRGGSRVSLKARHKDSNGETRTS
ncbi:MAG: hypothetical protein ACYDHM_11370 [Acidiferrobacterales bacterium]